MNEWPSGWFRDEKPAQPGAPGGAAGQGGPGGVPPGRANEPTVSLPGGGAGAAPAGAYAAAAPFNVMYYVLLWFLPVLLCSLGANRR